MLKFGIYKNLFSQELLIQKITPISVIKILDINKYCIIIVHVCETSNKMLLRI